MKTRGYFKIVYFIIGTMLIFTACEQTDLKFSDEPDEAITHILERDSYKASYSMFLELMEISGVKNTLTAYEPRGRGYSLFAPENSGFEAFLNEAGFSSFEALKQDTAYVRELVRYHIIMRSIRSIDFKLGTLGDTTATGDNLTMTFLRGVNADSVIYRINDEANVTFRDIEASNGSLHGIDRVLTPNVFTLQEWIELRGGEESEFSIFYKALKETGVFDLLTPKFVAGGRLYDRKVTIWIEPDAVFNKNGIFSYEDLKDRFSNTDDVTEEDNALYRFMAYHVMEGAYFLNDLLFEQQVQNEQEPSGIFNTYADQVILIRNDNEIRINPGGAANDTLFVNGDTIPVNYVNVILDKSNVSTRNGPVHFVTDLLEIEQVSAQTWRTDFLEEPLFSDIRPWSGFRVLEVSDYRRLTRFTIAGIPRFYVYVEDKGIWDQDRFVFDGDFTVSYETDKILPGRYKLTARFFRNLGSRAATVQFYLDGKRLGAPYDCSNRQNGNLPPTITLGIVDLTEYKTHTLTFDAVKAGRFEIFFMEFNTNLD